MLSSGEYDLMKTHPVQSRRIVDHIRFFSSAKGLFLHSVADAYDAMTSSRPYRNVISSDSALQILYSEKAKQFDPECVDAFTEWRISSP